MPELSPMLSVAVDAARAAETVIMRDYGSNRGLQVKPDQTPVTAADQEAECLIVGMLSERFPEHGFLGEEYGMTKPDAEHIWIIDPIDGTKNYIRGIPLFGTQIALMHRGRLVLGVSNLPALGELLYAESGQGAFLNGQAVAVSAVSELSAAQVSFGGLDYFERAGQSGNMLAVVRGAGRVRGFGDAYAYHLLASGRCEVVLEAKISIWDIAALSVIIREAGGRCTDLQGGAIGLETASMLASNGATLHDDIRQIFAD